MSLTVFTKCENCDKSVVVQVNKDDPLDRKYYCTDCCTSGTVIDTTGNTALVAMPVIKGFGDYPTTVNAKPVKTLEEKALDELKEFCLKGE